MWDRPVQRLEVREQLRELFGPATRTLVRVTCQKNSRNFSQQNSRLQNVTLLYVVRAYLGNVTCYIYESYACSCCTEYLLARSLVINKTGVRVLHGIFISTRTTRTSPYLGIGIINVRRV
jgi:hypothetical protein